MSRKLYLSFQRSNHHQNKSKQNEYMPPFWCCFAFPILLSILLSNSSFIVAADVPYTLPMLSDQKVNESSTKKRVEVHEVLFARATQPAAKTDRPKKKAFAEVPTDRKPAPVMDAETISAGLKSHDKALYIKSGWIRDPYISIGPERKYYYLTGTQPREGDPREAKNPYNIGLGDESIVGHQVRLWRSKDLIQWESLGPIFTVDDTMKAKSGKKIPKRLIWAPEVHWLADKGCWALVHCPKKHSSLALTSGAELQGPWKHPMAGNMGQRHDPSIFTDDDGIRYMLWGNKFVAPLTNDFGAGAN